MAQVTSENITPAHVKAARALLKWTAADLAQFSNVPAVTVRRFEAGNAIRQGSRAAVYKALTGAGAWFKNGGKPSVGLNHIEARK